MHDLPALLAAMYESDGKHQPGAAIGAVARTHVHMDGAQADRTMVAIASVAQRHHGRAAIDANESAVLVVPRHLRLPGFEFQGAGFRFFFGRRAVPGLSVSGTHSPPCRRRLLPVPASGA